jgi:CelD/BcsL family acetyltransferase involved in cellulose biosynthesis
MIAIGLGEAVPSSPTLAPGAAQSGTAKLLTPIEADRIADEWRALAADALEPNHFFLPDVVRAAMRSFAPHVRVLAVRAVGGRLIALAPVTPTRFGRIAPALRIWSHDYGPFGVPLVANAAIADAVSLLIGATPTLVFPDLPLDGPTAQALLRAARETGRSVSILDAHQRAALFQASAKGDLRAMQPTRRRKEFARQMRRLAELGPVTVEAASAPGAVTSAFEEFLALEAKGWKGRGATAIQANPPIAAFARAIVATRAQAGGARVDALRLAGKPVAMVVSFLDGASAWTWKIAFDEAYARFSPGAQLMLELPSRIFADRKIERIDSLATPDHPMIDHLWRDRIAIGTLVVGSGGPAHRLALLSAETELRARVLARRFRDRLRRGRRRGEESGESGTDTKRRSKP